MIATLVLDVWDCAKVEEAKKTTTPSWRFWYLIQHPRHHLDCIRVQLLLVIPLLDLGMSCLLVCRT